jgi:hypothetical protein
MVVFHPDLLDSRKGFRSAIENLVLRTLRVELEEINFMEPAPPPSRPQGKRNRP